MNYAIVSTGGKQYRVKPGDLIEVEKLPAEQGEKVELRDVLLLSREGQVMVGHPMVEGARVVAEVHSQGRDRKILVLKYKRKTRYRVTKGHRQSYTRLAIQEILAEEGEEHGPQKGRRKRSQRTGQQLKTPGSKALRRPSGSKREHPGEAEGDTDNAG